MKKMFQLLTVVAVAAMGLTACSNEFDEPNSNSNQGDVVVTFVAEPEATRTSVDTSSDDAPVFSWNDSESFAVLEQTDALAAATDVAYAKVEGKAHITATFNGNVGQGEYKYVTVYPASAYVEAESINAATLRLPAHQTMAEGSYDPDADLMVSKVVTTDVQPTEAQQVQFTRLVAVVKMTLKNFTAEQVEKVIFTAEGKSLAGTITTDLALPHAFTVAEGVSSVSVATTSNTDVYFNVLPTALEGGDSYTVTVLTSDKLYVKRGTISEGKTLTLEGGMVNRFGVNMEGVVASHRWELVRDASTLAEGDIVTIAAVNGDFVLGCNSTTNFPYASYNTNIIKAGDYLYHPIVTDATKYQQMVQPLILTKQDTSKAAFDFYNAVDYEGDTKSGYLTNAQTDNFLKLSAYPTRNSSFEIAVNDGVATIEAKDSEWDNTLLKFYNYNPSSTTNTYRRFVCIDAASINAEKHDDVCLYKMVGVKGVVPVAGAVVTVPDADESVVIAVEGVTEATPFEEVTFTYVGDWAIEVATDAQWLTLNYADGVLSYLAGANEGVARYANVTITATHEGEESKSWSFAVVQKGAPVKATVAEFITKAVDANVEYEVTGILTKKATSASGSTTIADAAGNVATFKYIDMANGDLFIDNTSINIGDIVTIIAAVSDEAIGGSSSAHAICKGYYNLEASVNNDLVAYTGGSVEVSLNKVGTLSPAGDISCTVDALYAELEYTTNADKAKVTLPANDGAPRTVVVTFTDGYAKTSTIIVQSADTSKGNTWELVTDASTLEAGDQVIIAAKDFDVAMSKTISSERREATEVTKLGNYYLTPTDAVQTFVLANGSAAGTFAFYDDTNKGFLASTSTSYKLNNQSYVDADASFTVTIADGVATIGNKEGDYAENKMYYRDGSSYNYFYSGETEKQALSLYRLVGIKGSIPVAPADVTVPDSDESVVVPEEGAAEATAINAVVFNYVGDWTITAAADVDWITFSFDKVNNCLTYTAQANEGTVRNATATITATLEGQEPLTWTFNVLQKGAPEEVTIAEFITKGKDENITYRLTGVVTTVPSSYSYAYVIEDEAGNKANIKYLKTEEGNYVVQDDTLDVRVGDVITVTTVVTTTTKGTGGSNSYPSYFKGYYRLTATADKDLVGYEGDTATVTLTTEGNLLPAGETIKGSMADAYDFVTFDYTENAATATATFAQNTGAARSAEFNFTFGLAPANVTIGQYNHPDVKVGWFLVTDVNELAVGDKVIIAAKNPDGDKDYAIKTWTNTSTSTSMQITLMGNSIKDATGLEQFTLASGAEAYPGTFAFVRADGRYLSNSSGSLKTSTTLGEYTSWSVTIDSANNGAATLKVSKAYSSKDTIMLNYTTSNQTFSIYKPTETGKGAIYLFKYYE
ncbi:MAG: hypothetical protein IJB03_03135 [Alistipes sp.]|nr:hypothetical protein [Alistipes sp.]